MRDLIRKIGRFGENHVEKIVLVLVGLVCVWLFFTRVIFSPNVVTVENRTFSPSQIDDYVHDKALELKERLTSGETDASPKAYASVLTGPVGPNHPVIAGIFETPQPLTHGFQELFDSPIRVAGSDLASVVTPGTAGVGQRVAKYKLPPIPAVTDVAANHIRAAAWVPLNEVTPQNGYDKVEVEPNDVDLVTLEGRIDVVELYRQFRAHFAGEEVQKPEWRDPCLADPIFAAVHLQRRQRLQDTTWGAWQDVPRSRVEPYRELFQVIDRAEDLPPGGLDVRLMQFDREVITMDLLQPEAYQIASAEEEWFPPSFYDKFKTLQKKVEIEEKREEREKQRDQQDRDTGRYRDNRGGTAAGTTGPGGRYRNTTTSATGDSMYGTSGGRDRRRPGRSSTTTDSYGQGAYTGDQTTRRRGQRTRTRPTDETTMYDSGMMYNMPGMDGRPRSSTDEVYFELAEKLINYGTDLSKLEEPLLFWVFDDTAEPGAGYEYRVRIGVFNPVAGTDQLVEQDMDKKNQVILWSEFSDVVGPVEIPRRLYLFAKNVQDRKNAATVEVARYALGYWHSEDFEVKPGEAIGKEMEPKTDEKDKRLTQMQMLNPRITGGDAAMSPYNPYMTPGMGTVPMPGSGYGVAGPDDVTLPKTIDYRTGKVLVDLVQVNDWGQAPNLRPRMYHEMLYTDDGANIEHMPVETKNWPKYLADAYRVVKDDLRKEKQPLRDFKKGGMRSRMQPGMQGGYQDMGMYDESMMYMMPGAGPYR